MFGRRRQLDDLQASLHRIEGALVVRDPGTARSVEAYDGLRKQVAAAMRHRRQHLVQIVLMADALDRGIDADGMRAMIDDWSSQAGLRRWTEPSPLHFFEVLGGEAETYEVVAPAWVDDQSDEPVLVKTGVLRAIPTRPAATADGTTQPDSIATDDTGGSAVEEVAR
jgi:hypothetical protein